MRPRNHWVVGAMGVALCASAANASGPAAATGTDGSGDAHALAAMASASAAPPASAAEAPPPPPPPQIAHVRAAKERQLVNGQHVQQIGRERMNRRGANSLADALEANAGTRVENDCQNCGFTQVRLNGLDGRYTAVLIDGRAVFSALAGVYGLEQLPPELFERVEIVKGSGSVLNGPGAIAGVVNVITARPRHDSASVGTRLGLIGGRALQLRLSGDATLRSEAAGVAVHVYAVGQEQEAYDRNGDGFSDLGESRNATVGADLYWDAPDGSRTTLRTHWLSEDRRGGDNLQLAPHLVAIAEAATTSRLGADLTHERRLAEHTQLKAGASLAWTRRWSYYGGGGDSPWPELGSDPTPAELSGANDTIARKRLASSAYGRTRNPVVYADLLLRHDFALAGTHTLLAAVQGFADVLRDEAPAYNRTVAQTFTNVGVLTEDDWAPFKQLRVVTGVRADKHSALEHWVITPRLSMVVLPSEWLKFRTVAGTGFRPPQVFDEDLHITIVGGEGRIVRNTPGLREERSRTFAEQAELTWNFAGWRSQFTIAAHHTTIRDAFVVDEIDDPNTAGQLEMVRVNRDYARVVGVEFDGELRFGDRFGAQAGWAFDDPRGTPHPDFGTDRLLRTPTSYGYFELWGRPVSGLRVSGSVDITGPMLVPHYAGSIPQNRLERSPWFADTSVGMSYTLPIDEEHTTLEFTLLGRNLFDAYQRDLDVSRLRDAGYVYGPRLPRSVFAGAKLSL